MLSAKRLEQIKKIVDDSYQKASNSIELRHSNVFCESNAISDTIPNFSAKTLEFGSYRNANYAVLFIDMRNSTHRAVQIGPEKTFLSMHIFIPAMLEVVKFYSGHVIDIMGDGIMVFFSGADEGMTNSLAKKHAALCALDMLRVIEVVVNPKLDDINIKYKINCGVGVTYGDVIVTKIGINNIFDVKAYGNCINKASKFSKGTNVKVSNEIRRGWPSSKGGLISFKKFDDGYIMNYKGEN